MELNWDAFEEEIRIFDYTYMMSDSHTVWQTGTVNEKILREQIKQYAKEDKERTQKLIKKHKSKYGTQFTI